LSPFNSTANNNNGSISPLNGFSSKFQGVYQNTSQLQNYPTHSNFKQGVGTASFALSNPIGNPFSSQNTGASYTYIGNSPYGMTYQSQFNSP